MFLLLALGCAPAPLESHDEPVVDTTPDAPETPDPEVPDPEVPETPDPDEATCTDLPFEMWCGHGELGFRSMVEGTEVEMVHGPQDAFHIPVAVMVRNAPQLLRFRAAVWDVGTGQQLGGVNAQAAFVPLVPGAWQCEGTSWNHIAVLSVADIPELAALGRESVALCGREAELEVEVIDAFNDEVYGTGSARFRLQPDPRDGARCE